jgi:general secretion pathway protein G
MSGNSRGFTFVELMVVLAIIAVLLTIALPRYFSGLERAQEAVLKEDLFTIREAIDDYYVDKGQYPSSLSSLVEERYLRAIPVDPITDTDESWIVLGLPDNPVVVYDVRSGAVGEASDGSLYYEW